MVKTMEQARRFIREVKICTVFPSDKVEHTSLWEHVDLPEKQAGEAGWGRKMNAVWTWKNRLPAEYPNEIYYGKIKGGFAVLMDMDYLAEVHFPQAYAPIQSLNELARYVGGRILGGEESSTTALREIAMQELDCTKSRFDTALKKLQISMNIVRVPEAEQDTWVPFRELYLDVWQRYVKDE